MGTLSDASEGSEPVGGSGGKAALLNQLKIDRSADAKVETGRPLKWFFLIALLAGVGIVTWVFEFPSDGTAVPIKTAVARATSAGSAGASVLDATGYVVARRRATVSAKITGKVTEVFIEEGMFVESGQLLAKLDDSIPKAQLELSRSQLDSAKASIEELNVQIRQAQLNLERTQGLAERSLASKADLDRDELSVEGLIARLSRVNSEINVAQMRLAVQQNLLSDMQIRAPFSGVVVAKAAQPGEMISPISAGGGFTRTGICTIVDMDSLEVEVDVNESYINRVTANQPVQVTLNAYPDVNFAAEVIAIIPTADRNKATVRVRVALLERDERVLPDMGVRVAFLDATADTEPQAAPEGVLIPQSAVALDTAGDYVFVVADQQVTRRLVRLGVKDGSRVRVMGGLKSGERVVNDLSEALLADLDDGVKVKLLN